MKKKKHFKPLDLTGIRAKTEILSVSQSFSLSINVLDFEVMICIYVHILCHESNVNKKSNVNFAMD